MSLLSHRQLLGQSQQRRFPVKGLSSFSYKDGDSSLNIVNTAFAPFSIACKVYFLTYHQEKKIFSFKLHSVMPQPQASTAMPTSGCLHGSLTRTQTVERLPPGWVCDTQAFCIPKQQPCLPKGWLFLL